MAASVSGEIRVTAGPAAVMGVIAEFERYPEWAKSVRRAAVGQRFPDGRPRTAHFWAANSWAPPAADTGPRVFDTSFRAGRLHAAPAPHRSN